MPVLQSAVGGSIDVRTAPSGGAADQYETRVYFFGVLDVQFLAVPRARGRNFTYTSWQEAKAGHHEVCKVLATGALPCLAPVEDPPTRPTRRVAADPP